LPGVDRAALNTVWPGEIPMRVGDLDIASTGLLTRYVRGAAEIEWNRARSTAALALIAADSESIRLSTGANLLSRVAAFLSELTLDWILNRGSGRRLDELNQRRSQLLADIEQLAPASPTAADAGSGGDAIHSVAQGVVQNIAARLSKASDNASLAVFVGDTLPGQLGRLEREAWHLIGLAEPPSAIARIRRLLSDLHAVLAEVAWGEGASTAVIAAARSGSANGALDRAARAARRAADKRHERQLASLVRLAAARGIDVHPVTAGEVEPAAMTWPPVRTVLIVELGSLAELDAARSAITEFLPEALLPRSKVTLLPARHGRTLPRFSATAFVAGGLYAAPEDLDAGGDVVPEPWATPLADAVVVAHQALQELSGIAYLTSRRSTTRDIQAAGDAAAREFRESVSDIQQLPSDSTTSKVVETLLELADRVQAETDGNPLGMPLAEAVIRGVALGEETEDSQLLGALIVVATEWDIDPAGAARLLEQ
jgi:hypothetical protein